MDNTLHTRKERSLSSCGPTLALKEGLDLNVLTSHGTEFEVSTDDVEGGMKELDIESNRQYFEGMQKLSRMFDKDEDDGDDSSDSDLSWFDRMKLRMTNVTEDGGVRKFIKKEGTGIVVPKGSRIRAHYDGYLEDLDEPFDSSRLRSRELQITLGKSEVIFGLDIGISTMRINEMARFYVSPDYAYGRLGCPPRIPENASILFEVELIAFTDCSLLDDYREMNEEERRALPFEQVLEVAKSNNALGNDLYGKENFGKAVRSYMKAINTLESIHLQNAEEEDEVVKISTKAYLNIALCHMQMGNYGKVVATCRKVIQWNHTDPKSHYLCGKALRHLGNFKESRRFLNKAHDLNPRSKDIIKEMETLRTVEAKCTAVEKEMCKKMFK